MHLYLIPNHKIAIFWSPRCCHKSLDNLLLYLNHKSINNDKVSDLSEQTHTYKNIYYDEIKDYKQILICRNPYERFGSFLRWKFKNDDIIKPNKDYVINFLSELIEPYDFMINDYHHASPQWSQAVVLLRTHNINNEPLDIYTPETFNDLSKYLCNIYNKDYIEINGKEPSKPVDIFNDNSIKNKNILSLFEKIFKEDIINLDKLGIDTTFKNII